MRMAQIAAICFACAALTFITDAEAQRQPAPLREATGPLRSAAERAATARSLGIIFRLSEEYLNSPFSLTARQPYVAGRGWIETDGAHEFVPRLPENLTGQDDLGQGWIVFYPGASTLHPNHPMTLSNDASITLLNATGRRFLVECLVSSVHVVRAPTATSSAQINSPSRQWLSIVTAPSEDRVTFRADPVDGVWYLMGCEATRLQ